MIALRSVVVGSIGVVILSCVVIIRGQDKAAQSIKRQIAPGSGREALIVDSNDNRRITAPLAKVRQGQPKVVLEVYLTKKGKTVTERVATMLKGINGVSIYNTCPTTGCLRFAVNRSDLKAAVNSLDQSNDVLHIAPAPYYEAIEPIVPLNINAQDTHQVQELRTAHHVNGGGVTIGIWDGGRVVRTHQEFGMRATQIDSPAGFPPHATHVAGTIGASGVIPNAQGMSPQINLRCFDWFSDHSELTSEAIAGNIVCSNHSYGLIRGWRFNPNLSRWEWWGDPQFQEDSLFGKYDGEARVFDDIVRSNPGLNVFAAAGNERGLTQNDPNTDPFFNGFYFLRQSGTTSNVARHPDMFDNGGFDTIAGFKLAKNVITIGAIEDITIDPPTANLVRVTAFSSWGPADDGRIKPDVVANGARLFSPTFQLNPATGKPFDDKYERMSGTSMATPAACSIGGLLCEVAMASPLGRALRADEMKAVLIHTAMSPHAGPSYQIGWGSIRADNAGDIVAGNTGAMRRGKPEAAGFELTGTATAGQPIRATVVWLDPPGNINTGGLDDALSALVHDLDLIVVAPDGSRFFPWSLDPRNPANPATRTGANSVDNVQRVDVDGVDAVAGRWTVRVTAAGAARDQEFAIVLTGLQL
jgi:hypothetical protein